MTEIDDGARHGRIHTLRDIVAGIGGFVFSSPADPRQNGGLLAQEILTRFVLGRVRRTCQ